MTNIKTTILSLLFIIIFAANSAFAATNNLILNPIVENLNSPIFVTAPKNDARLFIVQQNGEVFIFENDKLNNVLDISKKVTHSGEAGLLGFALHPDFLNNGLAYASYTKGRLISVIEEYKFDKEGNRFDINSAREIYVLDQPAGNHNGGMVAFGPDGYLYIGFGDGGGADDTYKHGQNFETALGTIIRLNIDDISNKAFSIPSDNPNVGGLAEEAWVYGLRNPWRFSFDGDLLFIGDVGQSGQEEISVIKAGFASSGANLGWPLAEGDVCYFDKSCKEKDLVWPVKTYPTSDGCSVIGGYVYRGKEVPELNGNYFYADFCNGEISSFKYENNKAIEQKNWSKTLGKINFISSFGIDGFGELYVISLRGTIYKLQQK